MGNVGVQPCCCEEDQGKSQPGVGSFKPPGADTEQLPFLDDGAFAPAPPPPTEAFDAAPLPTEKRVPLEAPLAPPTPIKPPQQAEPDAAAGAAKLELERGSGSEDESGQAQAFQISLMWGKDGDLGVTTLCEEGIDDCLVVTAIADAGAVKTWNASTSGPELKIADRIVSLDGQTCVPSSLSLPTGTQGAAVKLGVERWPETYVVRLQKKVAADKFGLKAEHVQRADGSTFLRIGAIRSGSGGLLEAWNQTAKEQNRKHDIATLGTEITSVSGSTDCDEMLAALQDCTALVLLCRRPPVTTAEWFKRGQSD